MTKSPGNDAGMREALKKAERALKPFSDRVYNDNGDISVTDTFRCGLDEFTAAYFAHRACAAALSPPTGSAGDDETGVREGYVLVPREATETMLKAAACQGVGSYSAHHAYRAMIDTAVRVHQPPKAETPVGVAFNEGAERWCDPNYRSHGEALCPACGSGPGKGCRAPIEDDGPSLAPAARAGDGVERYSVPKDKHRSRIQAIGAAISRRDWSAVEQAHADIRDAFDRPDIYELTAAPAANGEDA